MSDDKKKPSADEIVESVAEELGVKDQRSATDTSSDDALANLGGIFDVPRKKKAKKTGESAAVKAEDKPVAEEKPEAKAKAEGAAPKADKPAPKAQRRRKGSATSAATSSPTSSLCDR